MLGVQGSIESPVVAMTSAHLACQTLDVQRAPGSLANPVCGLVGEEVGEAQGAEAVLLAEVDGEGVAEELALPA